MTDKTKGQDRPLKESFEGASTMAPKGKEKKSFDGAKNLNPNKSKKDPKSK